MDGKCVNETISFPGHSHVNVLNQGGLLKVNEDVIAISSVAEAYFLSSTNRIQRYSQCTYGELHGARKFCQSKMKFPW